MRAWSLVLLLATLLAPAAAADDTQPPVLEAWAFAHATYGPGDEVTITGRASDETGVVTVLGHLRGPGDALDLWVHEEDCAVAASGAFSCTIALPEQAPSGTYRLERWSMRDAVGHFGPTYHHELVGRPGFTLSMQVEGPYDDADPPVLLGVEVTTPTVQAGEPVLARVRASDASGVASARVDAMPTRGDTYLGAPCEPEPGGAGTFACSGRTTSDTPSGPYRVAQVTLTDVNGVRRTYEVDRDFPQDADHVVAFTVEGGLDDHAAPVVDAIVATPLVPRGAPWAVTVAAHDPSGVHGVQVDVQTLQGTAYLPSQCPLEPAESVVTACSGVVPDNYPLGPVRILFVAVTDAGGNTDAWSTWTSNGPAYEAGPTMADRFHVGPRAVELEGGNASVPVEAIDAYVLEAPPGSVLPFALRLARNVTDLSFRLVNETGGVLGVQDCRADHDPEVIGVRCRLIVPPDAAGTYELFAVGADGAVAAVTDGPQRVHVTVGAEAPEPLPDDWRVHVEAGVTLGSFNGGVREPVAPWTPGDGEADPDPHPEDPVPVEPAPRGIPGPAPVLALLALAVLAARRR